MQYPGGASMPVNDFSPAAVAAAGVQSRLAAITPWELQDRARAAAIERQDQWPYPWVYMPPGGRPFNARGSLVAPAYGAGNQAVVTSYEVPAGYMGVLTHLFWQYIGTGFVEGSGTIVATVDINTPLGVSAVDGYSLPDFADMTLSVGDQKYPWPIPGGWVADEGQILRLKAYTTATVTVGAGNYIHGGLLGWIWPAQSNR